MLLGLERRDVKIWIWLPDNINPDFLRAEPPSSPTFRVKKAALVTVRNCLEQSKRKLILAC